jgi:predicted permease
VTRDGHLHASYRQELRWAWRSVKARGWRAVIIAVLFGVTLAANTIVFAAADAFVFRTFPYDQADRLVVIERIDRSVSDYIWPLALLGWRRQEDLFTGVHGHFGPAAAYVAVGDFAEAVRVERVTPGLFELLGVVPKWGRPFTKADASAKPSVATIGETLARRLFGDPAAALGRTLSTRSETLTVIGVMPASFRFPTGIEDVWRPLDLDTWPTNIAVRNIAKLRPDQTLDTAIQGVVLRRDTVAQAIDERLRGQQMRLRSMAAVRGNPKAATLFALLLGAAGCLLLIACANLASLELATVAQQRRTNSVQIALGASHWSLIRAALMERAVLLGASAGLGIAFTYWGIAFLGGQLPPTMRASLTHPLDVDARVMLFCSLAALGTWLLIALPSLWATSHLSVIDGLRDDPRTMPATPGTTRSRQVLVTTQVALTTMLLVGALLYLRSYWTEAGLDIGFDAANIATIEIYPAADAPRRGANLDLAILEKLRATPWIGLVSRTDSLPPSTDSGFAGRLNIEGRPTTTEWVKIHMRDVDPEYFKTMRIAVVQGRAFDAFSEADQVLVDERFAARYWPGSSPIGARFSIGGGNPPSYRVIGITRQLRSDRLTTVQGEEIYVAHIRHSPSYGALSSLRFVVRMDEHRLPDLSVLVRSLATRSVVRIETARARYKRLYADTTFAASVTNTFGFVALLVTATGIYAVMTWVVARRSKEMAIRMALGADVHRIRRMVLRSSILPVAAGGGIGFLGANLGSQWLGSQFSEIPAKDPLSYAAVAVLLMLTAIAATYLPARRASLLPPAITLRHN